jgi:ketosteroid isomerase-like protein
MTLNPADFSDAIEWRGPLDAHPAREASLRSYAAVASKDLAAWLRVYAPDAVLEDPVGPSMFDPEGKGHRGHDGISAFYEAAIAPIDTFRFTVHDSFANPESNTCANVGQIRTGFADGSHTTTDLVMVYVVDDAGLIVSMRAFWEPERTMASFAGVS